VYSRTHPVGGAVLVGEHVAGLSHRHLQNEGPGTMEAPGPKGYGTNYTIYRHQRRIVISTPAPYRGFGCEDRISVTGDHLSFDGNHGVRA
jgi:hypothetical protein